VPEQAWLRPEWEVDTVHSAARAHRCAREPRQCYAQPHRVQWKANGSAQRRAETFDVIVWRHGSQPALQVGRKKKPAQRRSWPGRLRCWC